MSKPVCTCKITDEDFCPVHKGPGIRSKYSTAYSQFPEKISVFLVDSTSGGVVVMGDAPTDGQLQAEYILNNVKVRRITTTSKLEDIE